jgi:hypothetical protein
MYNHQTLKCPKVFSDCTYLIHWIISVSGFHAYGSMREKLSPENIKQGKSSGTRPGRAELV